MSRHLPYSAESMNAGPVPIPRPRRRPSMSDYEDEEVAYDQDGYYRSPRLRHTVAGHQHHERSSPTHHHGRKEREGSLPRELRCSPSPERYHHHQRQQPLSHELPRPPPLECHHHHQHQQPRHHQESPSHCCCSNGHSSAMTPPRQVTFQSLPPPQYMAPDSVMLPPVGGHSTFLGPLPNQLRHPTHGVMLPPPPADYTAMTNLTGMNVQTMPFASPHVGGESGVGYPNAMPLSRSFEMLPARGQYGCPVYPKFVKPDYRRFCYSVGNADVPYNRNGLFPSIMAPLG